MELSENQNYIKYMDLFSSQRFEDAVEVLSKCLEDFQGDIVKESFLMKLMGDAHFYSGEIEKSLKCYAKSEEVDAESLQPKLFFAEFLAKKLKKYDEAIKKCNEILDLAKENPIEETDDDFGSDYYASKADEVRSFCRNEILAK